MLAWQILYLLTDPSPSPGLFKEVFVNLKLTFENYLCICFCVSIYYAYENTSEIRRHRIQALVNHLTWVLGTKLGSAGRA